MTLRSVESKGESYDNSRCFTFNRYSTDICRIFRSRSLYGFDRSDDRAGWIAHSEPNSGFTVVDSQKTAEF
tara:strand:- start:95 stop:307 length:213 start_codon:yes stop_codon:yes gene_type:complete